MGVCEWKVVMLSEDSEEMSWRELRYTCLVLAYPDIDR